MSNLLALKNRKKVIQNILRISTAMKAAAAVKMRKAQVYSEDFEPYINLIDSQNSLIFEAAFLPIVMNKSNVNTLNILIGCDSGMCGEFLSKVKSYFNYQSQHTNDDSFWLLLGAKLECLSDHKKFIYGGSVYLDSNSIHAIATRLWQFLKELNICTLVLHYFVKDEIKRKVVLSKKILLDALAANTATPSYGSIFSADVDKSASSATCIPIRSVTKATVSGVDDGSQPKNVDFSAVYTQEEDKMYSMNSKNLSFAEQIVSNDHAIFLLASYLYYAFLKSMYEENKQRIYAMSQAKTNAESMEKIVERLYNRARQEKITLALNEIIAGIQ